MTRFHPLTVAEVRRETPDAVSLRLAVPPALAEAFRFEPGQYLTLRATIDGEEVRRSYSICSGLEEGEIRVGIRRVADGAFSRFVHDRLRPGDVVEVMPPEGRFVARPDPAARRRYLAIAAGSGITPVLSIAKSVLAREPQSRFTLVYGNRTAASTMFAEAVEDLKNRHIERFVVVPIFSREPQDVPLLTGRIDAAKVRELAERGAIDVAGLDAVYLCGPEGMIAGARAALAALGMPAERIHVERFTPGTPVARRTPPPADPAAPTLARITVTLDGQRRSFDLKAGDPSIIEAAARAGIDIPYSCRGGMCCTCRSRVLDGAAEMAVNYSLEPWELAAGYILTCQARPTTPTLALDFDHL